VLAAQIADWVSRLEPECVITVFNGEVTADAFLARGRPRQPSGSCSRWPSPALCSPHPAQSGPSPGAQTRGRL